jgi:hypothetical protein
MRKRFLWQNYKRIPDPRNVILYWNKNKQDIKVLSRKKWYVWGNAKYQVNVRIFRAPLGYLYQLFIIISQLVFFVNTNDKTLYQPLACFRESYGGLQNQVSSL